MNAITKNSSNLEVKKFITNYLKADCDPDKIFQTTAENIENYHNANNKKTSKAGKKLMDVAEKVLMPLGLETHYTLAEAVNVRYRPLIIEVARQIEKEYDCKTYSEKALVEIIANAYVAVIDNSRRINNELGEPGQPINENRTKYMTMLSKQIDRVNRQFLSALMTLKQIKAPTMEINIKTKTAFVAQNQLINATNQSAQENENIKPK